MKISFNIGGGSATGNADIGKNQGWWTQGYSQEQESWWKNVGIDCKQQILTIRIITIWWRTYMFR